MTTTIKEAPLGKHGGKRITIDLDKGAGVWIIPKADYYRLGYPLDDLIIPAHALTDIASVTWCCIEQKWVD